MIQTAKQTKLILSALMCAVILLLHFLVDFGSFSQQAIIDKFKQFSTPVSNDLVIIEIDNESLKHFEKWPWPRGRYAALLEKLNAVKPKNVAFDLDFSEKTTELEDIEFSRVLKNISYPVILPTQLSFGSPVSLAANLTYNETMPLSEFSKYSLLANMNLHVNQSGLIFEYATFAENNRPSLGALLANKPNTPTGPIQLDFSIDPKSVPRISFKDILAGNFESAQISNKNILVGITAAEHADMHVLPIYGRTPGVLVHALAFETLNAEINFIVLDNSLTLILALLLFILLTMMQTDRQLFLPLAIASLTYGAAQLFSVYLHHMQHIVMPMTLTSISIVFFIFVQIVQNLKFKSLTLFREYGRNNFNKALVNQVITESLDGIIISDGEGKILVVNKKAQQLLSIDKNYEQIPTYVFDYISGSRELYNKIRNTDAAEKSNIEIIEREISNRYSQNFTVEMILRKSKIVQYSGAQQAEDPLEIFSFTISDVSEKKNLIAAQQQSDKALDTLKNNDPLTHLPNRKCFNQRVDIAYAHQYNNESTLVMLINLDSLKEINEIYGMDTGDDIIIQTGHRLSNLVGEYGFVARFSDKVFGIVYNHESFDCDLVFKDLIHHVYALFKAPYKINEDEIIVNVSIGAVLAPHHGNTTQALLNNAVLALDYAKLLDVKKWFVYEEGLAQKMRDKREVRTDIKRALKNDEFVLFYQPQYDIVAGRLIGFESLVRWFDPVKGLRYPDEFIPVAEEFGLIDELGELVLNMGCRDAAAWPSRLTVAINVSAMQFKTSDMAALCSKYLKQYDLPANRLELEITESAMMDNMAHVVDTLAAIQKLGVKIAMDDFGTGYSSLQYLTELPIDKIKIDRSFINNIGSSKQSDALITTIITLGHSLDKQVLAEGIETETMAMLLKAAGCQFGQGYYYGRPMPINKVIDHIADIDSVRKIG